MPMRFEVLSKLPKQPMAGNPPLYEGVCPACRSTCTMHLSGKRGLASELFLLVRILAVMAIKPIDTAKNLLANQKMGVLVFCRSCDERLFVCPSCYASTILADRSLGTGFVCPNCNANYN